MRRIFGLAILGGALIAQTSAANAQVTVTPGNGFVPTQVTVGQPNTNTMYAPNAYAAPGYGMNTAPGYGMNTAPRYQSGTTYYNSGYQGYRAPWTANNGRSYYVPAQVKYRRMGRPRFGGWRNGRQVWYTTPNGYR